MLRKLLGLNQERPVVAHKANRDRQAAPRPELKTAGEFANRESLTLDENATCAEAVRLFAYDSSLLSVPVLDMHRRPIGLLHVVDVLRLGSRRYYTELHGNEPCTTIMNREPFVFDVATRLHSVAEVLAREVECGWRDSFIVTRSGRYYGMGRVQDLMKALCELQLSSARHANPVTLLPGNVTIDQEIERHLRRGISFVAVHWDLDSFKPFNDLYGYRMGDEIIRLTARILENVTDATEDFLGHIGGDDFISLYCSKDWESRIQRALNSFDNEVRTFFTNEHRRAGGFTAKSRRGETVFYALTSLSAGVIKVDPHSYATPAQLARALSSAKLHAKQIPGSSYFVERRRPEPTGGAH